MREKRITRESIEFALTFDPKSVRELLKLMGAAVAQSNYHQLRRVVEKEQIILPFPWRTRKSSSIIANIDKQTLMTALIDCRSRSEFMNRLGYVSIKPSKPLMRAMEQYGLTIPDGTGVGSRRGTMKHHFDAKKRITGQHLRRALVQELQVPDICAHCGIGPQWNNKALVLQIDHKDGDNTNNLPTNLQILCPNCHSQTSTFAGRNIPRSKQIHSSLV